MRLSPDTETMPEGLEVALRDAFLEAPSPATEKRHLAEMHAALADAGTANAKAGSANHNGHAGFRVPTRLRLAAAVAAVVLALPVAFAGLALAGVRLPDAVDSAFETVGIDLPNQDEDGSARGGDEAVEDAEAPKGESGQGGEARSSHGGGGGDDAGKGASESDRAGGEFGGSGASPSGQGGNDGPPGYAQDGQTGAPAHSQQGGQGVGTPPAHAQDGAGGPPPHAQDGDSGLPPAAQGAGSPTLRPPTAVTTTPDPPKAPSGKPDSTGP